MFHYSYAFYLKIRMVGVSDEQFGDITVATFDRRGKYVVVGTSKGRIAFFDSKTVRLVTYVRQNATHQVFLFCII